MKQRISRIWLELRSSFWFVPSLMVVGAVALAGVLGWLDQQVVVRDGSLPSWLSAHGASNVRALLAMIAGSMITVAGVTFSVVIVALAQASQQFGPRLLRHFMQDRGNQVVLGTFVATFLYSTLVLGQIHPMGEGDTYVPRISALVAVLLAVASIGVLVFFFHHVATSMQADQVVLRAGDAMDKAVRAAFPDRDAVSDDSTGTSIDPAHRLTEENCVAIPAEATGYVASVDVERLIAVAEEYDLLLAIDVDGGDFVLKGQTIARSTGSHDDAESHAEAVADAIQLVTRRSASPDLDLAVDRLAEVAVRALSPGINDPYTAVACVDRLGTGLVLMAERGEPARVRSGSDGTPRVLLRQPTYEGLLGHAFSQICHYGQANEKVLRRVLEALAMVASRARSPELQRSVRDQAEMVDATAQECLRHEREKQRIGRRLQDVLELLDAEKQT